MIIKSGQTNQKNVGPMIINEYRINPDFSASLIRIDGNHGKVKCIGQDRIYFIVSGFGKFILDDKEEDVSKNDLIFVPKNTPYDFRGKMEFLLVHSPEFKPGEDIHLED